MSQTIPTKYVNEAAVKHALKTDTFRNLSKEKLKQFASMLPYMDKDVALAVINQFPSYVDFGKVVIDAYKQLCDEILDSNQKSQADVIKGYQTILDALALRLEKPHLNRRERKAITEDMISVANLIEEADLQNKKFLEKMGQRVNAVIFSALAAAGAGIGLFVRSRRS